MTRRPACAALWVWVAGVAVRVGAWAMARAHAGLQDKQAREEEKMLGYITLNLVAVSKVRNR